MKYNSEVHRQKIFCVITVARQIEGEFCFVRTEKAFKEAHKADELAKKLNEQDFTAPDGKRRAINLSTPQGSAECVCIAGAFEMELVE
jgi:hypothetical protein